MGLVRDIVRPVVRNMVYPVDSKYSSWSSYWRALSTFWSDGTIEDGRLKDVLGRTEVEPALVDSNCLIIAVDDTITFASLAGWSIVSNLGTATIVIDGNTVKCTGAGSLYKMILSDGTNQHTYPLAEGGYTIAFDTFGTPSHGAIVCASLVWSKQDEYHKNIEGYKDRSHIDKFEQSVFLGDGVPTGWTNTWGVCTITTTNNIVRVTTPAGGISNYYKFNVSRYATVTTGQKIRGTLRIRASEAMIIEIRGGSETSARINVTTEWQTLTSTTSIKASSTTALGITATRSEGDLWFEFDYVFIEQLISETYRAPRRDGSIISADGKSLDIVGDGRFINCETCLLFPDVEVFQTIDDHLEFFYERYGDRRKLSWERLYSNPYGMDRAFVDKSGDVLERMVVINPSSFNRDSFIKFLTYINRPSYVYNKITNGCVIDYNIGSRAGDLQTSILNYANSRGALWQSGLGNALTEVEYLSLKELYMATIESGNPFFTNKLAANGCTSFDLIDEDEENRFSDEITNGDLIVIDTYDSKRGAYVAIDFPNFVTAGTLTSTTKVSGSLVLDNYVGNRYSPFLWIPAGQSGVPSEIEEIPLTFDTVTNKLYFRKWDAALHFGVTFTNTDAINIYYITGSQYFNLISVPGLTCYFNHARTIFDMWNVDLRSMGWNEGHPGELIGAQTASKALWDAGMLFGSSGDRIIRNRELVFANQNNPREWCGCFGHSGNGAASQSEMLNTTIPLMSEKNNIYEWDYFRTFVTDLEDYQQLAEKCDEYGVLLMSALDFIKNMQFNDYDAATFFKD